MTDTQEEKFITHKEAVHLFAQADLSDATFRRWVRKGKIEKILPPGKKRGALYPLSQVLEVLCPYTFPPVKVKKRQLLTTTFRQATPADMPEMAVLLETFYHAKISVVKRSAWIERNPDCAFILRTTTNDHQLVGCAFLMPLAKDKITQILSSQVKPATRPQEILIYESGHHYSLYLRAAGVLQSVSREQRRHWAARLVVGLTRAVIALGARGIFIDEIYAQGDTRAGEKALKMLGFTQIEINAPTSRKNFLLDIEQSGSPFAMQYKHVLNRWRAQNEED